MTMKLNKIVKITATLKCESGLHIGGSETIMHIGGTDNYVIKNPVSGHPYIPGSSLKGKLRFLLEWRSGEVKGTPLSYNDYASSKSPAVKKIIQLFGVSADANLTKEMAEEIGTARLSFWDCNIDPEWIEKMKKNSLLLTEIKTENVINRITGTAEHPRQIERVVAGTPFAFNLSLKVFDKDNEQDLINEIFSALKLLELDSLGGSGSRGYGKVKFEKVCVDGVDKQTAFDNAKPF